MKAVCLYIVWGGEGLFFYLLNFVVGGGGVVVMWIPADWELDWDPPNSFQWAYKPPSESTDFHLLSSQVRHKMGWQRKFSVSSSLGWIPNAELYKWKRFPYLIPNLLNHPEADLNGVTTGADWVCMRGYFLSGWFFFFPFPFVLGAWSLRGFWKTYKLKSEGSLVGYTRCSASCVKLSRERCVPETWVFSPLCARTVSYTVTWSSRFPVPLCLRTRNKHRWTEETWPQCTREFVFLSWAWDERSPAGYRK